MKFSVAAATLISLVPTVLGLTIDTPTNVVMCQPIRLAWRDGVAPFYLSLIPGGQISAAPIKTFPTQEGTLLTWTVDLEANTNFNIALKDSSGQTAYSDIVTVAAGSGDRTCLTGGTSNLSSPPNTGGSSPTNTASGNPASSSGSSTRASPSSTPSSGSSGGATSLALSSFGVAGVIGAIAALF